MVVKSILVLCASALFVQTISGQSMGNRVYADDIDITNIGVTKDGVGLVTGGEGFGNKVGMGSGYGSGLGYGYGSGLGLAGYGAGLGMAGCGTGLKYGAANIGYGAGYSGAINNRWVATGSGGDFPVSTSSSIAPSGLAVVSENNIDGQLAVVGALPFAAAVALEGQVPSSGSAGVQYSCGDSNIGIVSESVGAGLGLNSGLGSNAGLGFNAGLGYKAGLGYNAGLGYKSSLGYSTGLASGCGCGRKY